MTDAEFQALLPGLLCGEQAAFTTADRFLRPMLHKGGCRIVLAGGCGWECLEEVVQDALCQVFRTVGTFRGSSVGQFSTWGKTIVRGKACDHLRRCAQRRVVTLSDPTGGGIQEVADGSGVLDAVLERELVERIRNALELIPRPQADALRLREIDGMPYDEIARALGCTEVAARWRVHRARYRLALLLQLDPALLDADVDP